MRTHTPRAARLTPIAILATLLIALGSGVSRAEAAWPGREGPVLYAGLAQEQPKRSYAAVGLRAFQPDLPASATEITADRSDLDPQVSPDGRLVVFSRRVREGLEETASAIFVVGIDGSGLRQLTDGGTGFGGDVEPSFYPSGKRIVFVRRSDVYSVGLDGSGLRRITASYADEHAPVVSPTGRQIAFECANYKRKGIEYSNEHICSIRPDGSRRRDLTPRFEGGQEAFDPDFSPSGRVISFSVGPGFAADVFTMRANGARLGALTNRAPRGGRKFPRDVGYDEPAFSPAGGSIVAVARSGERPRFVRIRLDDPRHPRPLGEHFLGRQPVWAPAG